MMKSGREIRSAKRWGAIAFGLFVFLLSTSAFALSISDEWRSPRNRERERRRETRYIILHTTESKSSSALQKLQRNGEAHYLIDEKGRVFRIVDHRRIAYHCGRSMWNGRANLDLVSIGIEVAGYHNRSINAAQLRSLESLVKELQRIYKIPDERVMPHSMVAYGAPNRWHSRNHRGRKRCGMQFARDDVRHRIGLNKRPLFDPDVRAGRLVSADPHLAGVLFAPAGAPVAAAPSGPADADTITARRSAWDIAREHYNSPGTRYTYPDGTEKRGNEISNWRAMPAGTRVQVGGETESENVEGMPRMLGRDGDTLTALAGEEWNRPDTLYLFEGGRIVAGNVLSEEQAKNLPAGLRIWLGFRDAGEITARRRAFDLCGPQWNAPDTFYLFPNGTVTTGDQVDERRIPIGTRILHRAGPGA